jgi:hypothetical protein
MHAVLWEARPAQLSPPEAASHESLIRQATPSNRVIPAQAGIQRHKENKSLALFVRAFRFHR